MHVKKLVDLVSKIPKPLGLNISEFSMNYYAFSKFAVLSSNTFCRLDPGIFVSSKDESLAEQRRGMAALFLARMVPGGRGPVGEKDEGSEGYLRRVLARRERAGGGRSAEEQDWR